MEHRLHRPAAMRFVGISAMVGVAVIATVAIPAGCVAVDSLLTVECVSHEVASETLPIPNDDAALDFKIQRCQIDADACIDLCALVLTANEPGFTATSCHASFTETSVTVRVGYDRPTNASGCQNGGVFADDTGGSGMGGSFPDAAAFPTPVPPDASIDDASMIAF